MDILSDIFGRISAPEDLTRRVETDRFGPVTFRLGLDRPALTLPLVRVQDAKQRFAGSPLAQVANRLEPEVLVESVHGTDTIEGGDLSPDETRDVLALPPEQLTAQRQRRVQEYGAMRCAYCALRGLASRQVAAQCAALIAPYAGWEQRPPNDVKAVARERRLTPAALDDEVLPRVDVGQRPAEVGRSGCTPALSQATSARDAPQDGGIVVQQTIHHAVAQHGRDFGIGFGC